MWTLRQKLRNLLHGMGTVLNLWPAPRLTPAGRGSAGPEPVARRYRPAVARVWAIKS
jgi:hypothetical protein